MADPQPAVAELRRAVNDLGFGGAAIGTNANGRNVGDEDFLPFWTAVRDLDCLVFFHPVAPVGGKDRRARHMQANFVGLPIDSAAAIASLLFDGVYERFRPLKTCFDARWGCISGHSQPLGARSPCPGWPAESIR